MESSIQVGIAGRRFARAGNDMTQCGPVATPEEFADSVATLVAAFADHEDGRVMPTMPMQYGEPINRRPASQSDADRMGPIARGISGRLRELGVEHDGWKVTVTSHCESGGKCLEILFTVPGGGYLPYMPSVHVAPAVVVRADLGHVGSWMVAGQAPSMIVGTWVSLHADDIEQLRRKASDQEAATAAPSCEGNPSITSTSFR